MAQPPGKLRPICLARRLNAHQAQAQHPSVHCGPLHTAAHAGSLRTSLCHSTQRPVHRASPQVDAALARLNARRLAVPAVVEAATRAKLEAERATLAKGADLDTGGLLLLPPATHCQRAALLLLWFASQLACSRGRSAPIRKPLAAHGRDAPPAAPRPSDAGAKDTDAAMADAPAPEDGGQAPQADVEELLRKTTATTDRLPAIRCAPALRRREAGATFLLAEAAGRASTAMPPSADSYDTHLCLLIIRACAPSALLARQGAAGRGPPAPADKPGGGWRGVFGAGYTDTVSQEAAVSVPTHRCGHSPAQLRRD